MKLPRIYALIRKEFQQIRRDPSTLWMAFVLPLILLFIYGYGISLDITQMKLSCLMEDRSPPATSFIQTLSRSRFFSLTFVHNPQELAQQIQKGDSLGGLTIPSYFSDFLANHHQIAPLYLVTDGSQPNTAHFVQNYVAGALSTFLQETEKEQGKPAPPTARLIPRFWYNEELDSHHFLIPGSIAIIMTLIGTILTALVIAREWERGTMESLLATPLSMIEIVIGKLLPYFILGFLSMILCTVLGCYLFAVPLRGSLMCLGLISSLFLLSALGTGLLISSCTKNQYHASQIAIVSGFLPAFMLSGFIFEISSMPPYIQYLTYLIPAKYMVSSLQTLFLTGTIPSLLYKNGLALLAFSIAFFLLLSFKTKKSLE